MELKNTALVLVDITGYTKFITWKGVSLLHAEEIITKLLETVIDKAEYPLELNKLEGDAIFLYTNIQEGKDAAVAEDVLNQVMGFFQAFRQKQLEMIKDQTGVCPCEACSRIPELRLKAFVHAGEVLIKQIRQFTELAGQDVILIHRLLKNEVPSDEYLLLTEQYHQFINPQAGFEFTPHSEEIDLFGRVNTFLLYPQGLPALPESVQSPPVRTVAERMTNFNAWLSYMTQKIFDKKR